MSNPSCQDIRDMLVDYCDGALSEHATQTVTGHLAHCATCHKTAEALTRSLDVTQAIWHDNLTSAPRPSGTRSVARIISRWRYGAVAAALLIVAGGAFLLCTLRSTRSQAPMAQEVEQYATRAGAAARMLAATEVLAGCEGTESLVEQQCRYILSHYSDTPAAAALKAHVPSTLKGTRYD